MSLATPSKTERVTKDNDEAMTVSPLSTLPLLPHIIWRRVVYYLSESLLTLLSISSLHPDLQNICRPYTSSFFKTLSQSIPPLSSSCYYHSLVQLILEGHVDPSYIYEVYLPQQRFGPVPPARRSFLQNPADRLQLHCYDRQLRQTVHQSPWIPEDLESEVCTRFQDGDPDAALVILLPLCTRLKMLELPGYSELCEAMFQSVAYHYKKRGIIAEEARQIALSAALRDRNGRPWQQAARCKSAEEHGLPFAELLILYVGSHQHGYSFPLITMTSFMGIPSLCRIILTAVRDQDFPGSPAGDAACSCPQIYFQQSSVSKQAVLVFAECIQTPCEIRQWYERPRPGICGNNSDGPDWDRVVVKRDTAGNKVIEVRFDFGGGNPGYDHAWVSWLWRGKMVDWTRFDEEFSLEDDDVEEPWLSGSFG